MEVFSPKISLEIPTRKAPGRKSFDAVFLIFFLKCAQICVVSTYIRYERPGTRKMSINVRVYKSKSKVKVHNISFVRLFLV